MKLNNALLIVGMLFSIPALSEPLTVTNGRFTKDGKPFYGVGVNYFDGFTRYAANKNDKTWKTGLATLHQYQVPFIRVNTFGFWSDEIAAQYLNNKQEFYNRLDEFMGEAEKQNIGVVLDLFFNLSAFTDLNGDLYGDLSNDGSKTRKLMREITIEIVNRYKSHPALWGWEFANETNQVMDLPPTPPTDNYKYLPPRNAANSPPRTAKEDFGTKAILRTMTEFSQIVRQLDPRTPIFSGNGMSMKYSYHLWQLHDWDADTPDQFGLVVSRDNPGRINTFTLHLYPNQENLYFNGTSNYSRILATTMARSEVDNKPFFLGEFGVNEDDTAYDVPSKFYEITSAIMSNHVPLSALWVFDKAVEGNNEKFNVSATVRTYQLERIQKMNQDMQSW